MSIPPFAAQVQTKQLVSVLGNQAETAAAASTTSLDDEDERVSKRVYQRGLATIAFITLLFASNSPALHALYASSPESTMAAAAAAPPPVLLLNAVCSVIALLGMLLVGPLLNQSVEQPVLLSNTPSAATKSMESNSNSNCGPLTFLVGQDTLPTLSAGMELGLYKFLGTLANVYGLSLTTASHGAFLIQLTTLLVPLAQGVAGVAIPARIGTAIGLALTGVALFTMDSGNASIDAVSASSNLVGDAACVVAAILYATYDLRLFHWGQRVNPLALITTKIGTQTLLSLAVLLAFAAEPSLSYIQSLTSNDGWPRVLLVALWSGLAVNAVAPYLQVGGQQTVGPARAQILYASQPLWASIISVWWLGETVGTMGLVGGVAFLSAMMLAATAPVPDPNCEQEICEV
jgi:drug/metabolite transporter (DMT)-like permease